MSWVDQLKNDLLSSPTTPGAKARKQKLQAAGFLLFCLIVFAVYVAGSKEMKDDEPKSRESISLVQHFCGPGYSLQGVLVGQDWNDERNWAASRYPLPVNDEHGEIHGHDVFEVVFRASVMDGLDEKKIQAEWLVDLNTKRRSPENTAAKSLFVCF